MTGSLGEERRRRAAALLREEGWDAVLVYGNAWRCDYLRYLSDFPILEGHGFVLLDPAGELTLFLESAVDGERAEIEAPGCEIVVEPDIFAAVNRRLDGMANARLALAPAGQFPKGIRTAERHNIVDATDALNRLLMHKSEAEIDAVRRAAILADEGYEVFMDAARPGRKEYELIAEVEAFFRDRGCPDNFQILGSGGPEVRGMHPPGERVLRAGDLVTTEVTPCVDGYYAQLCRTLVIGEPTRDQLKAFDIYKRAMEAGLDAVRPGVTAGEIARIENDVFRAEGLGDYTTSKYTRVRGHGIGIYLDTPPALLEDVTIPLAEGMTIIVHPNTYHPVVGYIVLGDSCVVRADGAELLSHTERTLFSVPV